MDSATIKTFLDLTRTLHISQTAHNLYLSQSTISQRLSALEKTLGYKLFERGRGQRKMSLTARGKSFIPLAQRWFALTNDLERWRSDDERLELEIGTHESINTYVLNDFYQAMSRDEGNDQLHLRIRSKSADELYKMLRRREIHLALIVHPDYYDNVEIRKLYSEPYSLILPAGIDGEAGWQKLLPTLPLKQEIFLPWDRYYWNWHSETLGPAFASRINLDIVPMIEPFLASGDNWLIAPVTVAAGLAERCGRAQCLLTGSSAPPYRNVHLVRSTTETKDEASALDKFTERLFAWLARHLDKDVIDFYF